MEKEKYVLAFDLGTGGVKAVIADGNCRIVRESFEKYDTFASAGYIREQRPRDWWEATVRAVKALGAGDFEISAIGSSGHSMGCLPIGRDGRELEDLTPIWSDSRGIARAEEFFGKVDYENWYGVTGNGSPAGHYAVFKIAELKAKSPDVYEKTAVFIGTKDYVNLKLTGRAVSDFSYASGSGVYDLEKREYRDDYIAAAGIDRAKLPELYESFGVIGHVTASAARELGITPGIPVTAGGVDNGCMALGAGCVTAGDTYCSLGTSAWIARASGSVEADATRPYIFAHVIPGLTLTHQGIFSSGSSHNWVIDKMFPDLSGEDKYKKFDAFAEASPAGANGVFFCPALAGGSAADVSPDMKGGFSGFDLGTSREDIARSVLEGLALQMRYVARTMPSPGGSLILTGGGAKGKLTRQIFADVFAVDVAVTEVRSSTAALGAAASALVGIGARSGWTFVRDALGKTEITHPIPENVKLYDALFPKYSAFLHSMK